MLEPQFKPTTVILYEVNFSHVRLLPPGLQVLKQCAHGGYFLQDTGIDNITYSPGARYFLFKYPSLPEVQSFDDSEINIKA